MVSLAGTYAQSPLCGIEEATEHEEDGVWMEGGRGGGRGGGMLWRDLTSTAYAYRQARRKRILLDVNFDADQALRKC